MKVLIYGTSSKAIEYIAAIALNYDIVGFIETRPEKKVCLGKPVYAPSELTGLVFDLVIIASSFESQIRDTLTKVGVVNVKTLEELEAVQVIHADLEQRNIRYRLQKEHMISKVALPSKHIQNAALVGNRQQLLSLLPKYGVVGEMGVAAGDFSQQILNVNQPNKFHLIDIWGSDRYSSSLFESVKKRFENEISNKTVEIHRQLSHEAASVFSESYFDWIYIDTTHSYAQTKLELELYQDKVKPGGYIAGHDYQMCNWVSQVRYGVIEAVHEFCVSFNYEIIYLTMDVTESQSFVIKKK
ncbi:MAG: class I SAM-dependent methyltransferase [Shewanella sp.]|uniref:class I SAM-dependent methyltransferase n=1 Tax=Shewanella sp. TaxID=50422 RepID=UPI003001B0C0